LIGNEDCGQMSVVCVELYGDLSLLLRSVGNNNLALTKLKSILKTELQKQF
jgi:hypothetical protein